MPTTLIINADDFGFSPGITDGILHAHTHGVLTSTTLMTTMPDRDRTLHLALATPTLGVGIHLSLTQGTPLTSCPKLLDANSAFPRSLPNLAFRLTNALAAAQAEAEWDAQIQYALTRGLKPTHLDSHKHIHHFPMLQRIIANVARRFDIPYVRCAREITPPGLPKPSLSYRLLIHFAHKLAARLARHHLRTTDAFFGLATTGSTNISIWQSLVDHLRLHAHSPHAPATIEVMVHPGNPQNLTPADTRLRDQRTLELTALLDPHLRGILHSANITLAHYGQLPTASAALTDE